MKYLTNSTLQTKANISSTILFKFKPSRQPYLRLESGCATQASALGIRKQQILGGSVCPVVQTTDCIPCQFTNAADQLMSAGHPRGGRITTGRRRCQWAVKHHIHHAVGLNVTNLVRTDDLQVWDFVLDASIMQVVQTTDLFGIHGHNQLQTHADDSNQTRMRQWAMLNSLNT